MRPSCPSSSPSLSPRRNHALTPLAPARPPARSPARLVTLSHFSQAVYLLFSAVYVCKESVEHVLLLHGPHDAEGAHGAGHGGVGHGEGLAVLGLGEGHGDRCVGVCCSLWLGARRGRPASTLPRKRTTR